jgi:excisionase family DNA binding protein
VRGRAGQKGQEQFPVRTERFCGVDDACERLCIGRSKFYQLVREGKIEVRKLGSRSLVSESSLAAFAESLPTLHGRAA